MKLRASLALSSAVCCVSIGLLFAVGVAVSSHAITAFAAERGPAETVRKYLEAMQNHRFEEAYDYVSSTLRGGKSREEWAKEQQYIVQMGEVKIFGFKVFPAEMVGEKEARVPNILKSQDKYLNQLGLDEYEGPGHRCTR